MSSSGLFLRTKISSTCQTKDRVSPFGSMQNINIEPRGVNKLLKDLKNKKPTGSDTIPAFVLKTAAEEITPVLTRLLQLSIDTCEVPIDWKKVWDIPIRGERPCKQLPPSVTQVHHVQGTGAYYPQYHHGALRQE